MIAANPTASARVRRKPDGVSRRRLGHPACGERARGKGDQASVKFRVMAVSTGMPGPVVVEMTIFFR
jgi:hypothetical protein